MTKRPWLHRLIIQMLITGAVLSITHFSPGVGGALVMLLACWGTGDISSIIVNSAVRKQDMLAMDKAYNDGIKAFTDGATPHDNPYNNITGNLKLFVAWATGYMDALVKSKKVEQ